MPSNAQRIQGAGPTGTEGDVIGVAVVSGGGGAVTIADGADVTQGSINDAPSYAVGTVNAHLRQIAQILAFAQGAASMLLTGPDVYNDFPQDQALTIAIPEAANTGSGFFNKGIVALRSSTGWKFQRTPDVFRTVQAAAVGNTAIWTPAAGMSFRLTRYCVEVTGNASFAVAGVLTISLFDGAAGAIGLAHDVYIPVAAAIVPGAVYSSPWIDLGNGVISSAADNILNVNLSAALATGNVRVIACGTEE